MSKQQQAKDQQRYEEKPVLKTCSNCENFKFDIKERPDYYGGTYTEETNIRCGIGNFKAKKTATCREHKVKVI